MEVKERVGLGVGVRVDEEDVEGDDFLNVIASPSLDKKDCFGGGGGRGGRPSATVAQALLQ